MGIYRKIEIRVWADEKFRRLSPLQPSGQALWFYLLTGPQTGIIPGLFKAGHASMAEDLGWSLEAFDEAFGEVLNEGLVKDSPKDRLIWIPKASKYNPPASPNVVRSWAVALDNLPECPLLFEALSSIRNEVYSFDKSSQDYDSKELKGFRKAFDEAFGEVLVKAFDEAMPKGNANPSPNQEQEQEQEQNKKEDAHVRDGTPIILSSWYKQHQTHTSRLISPSESDRRDAVAAMAQLGGDEILARQCVDYYWANWQKLYFAVKKGTKDPDWNFRSFARNITSCIPAHPEPSKQPDPPKICPACGSSHCLVNQGCFECGYTWDCTPEEFNSRPKEPRVSSEELKLKFDELRERFSDDEDNTFAPEEAFQ